MLYPCPIFSQIAMKIFIWMTNSRFFNLKMSFHFFHSQFEEIGFLFKNPYYLFFFQSVQIVSMILGPNKKFFVTIHLHSLILEKLVNVEIHFFRTFHEIEEIILFHQLSQVVSLSFLWLLERFGSGYLTTLRCNL